MTYVLARVRVRCDLPEEIQHSSQTMQVFQTVVLPLAAVAVVSQHPRQLRTSENVKFAGTINTLQG